jgi:hypothetical protein
MVYVIALVVIAVTAFWLHKHLYARPVKFKFKGERYVWWAAGRITDGDHVPISDPDVAAAAQQAVSEKAGVEREERVERD